MNLLLGSCRHLSSFEIPLDDNGFAICSFGDFDEVRALTTQTDKLSFLLTMIAITEVGHRVGEDVDVIETFTQTDGFQKLNEFVKCYCQGLSLDGLAITKRQSMDETHFYIDCDVCVGALTFEYDSLQDYLDFYDTTIKEIILSNNAVIVVSCDEH